MGAVSIYLLINLLFYLLINLCGWGGGGMGADWGWLSRSGQGPLSLCHPQPPLSFLGPCSPPSPSPFASNLLYGFALPEGILVLVLRDPACVCLIPPAATTTTKLINSLDQGQLAGLRLSIPGVLPVTGQVGTMMLPL